MELIILLFLTASFIIGFFVGFVLHMLMDVTAMRMGKAFFKKRDNRWYPFNPFISREKESENV